MQTILLSILIFILPFTKNPKNDLLGKWKLIKAEVKGKTIVPTKYTWMLDISDTQISYTIQCNGCFSHIILRNDSIISVGTFMCTEMCCYGWDPISEYAYYTGKYKVIDDSVLRITNNHGTLYLSRFYDKPKVPDTNQIPYNAIFQQKAEFPGDENKWIADHIIYPDSAKNAHIEGVVWVEFEVDATGRISRTKLLRGICPDLDREALRVVRTMPKWKPAMHDGKPVKIYDNAQVRFVLKE